MGCSAAEAQPFTARTSLASSEGLFLLLFSGDCRGPDLQQMSDSCFFLCWSHQWRVITVARWSCSFIHQSEASLWLQSSEGCKMLTSWQTLIRARHLSSSSIFYSGCIKASVSCSRSELCSSRRRFCTVATSGRRSGRLHPDVAARLACRLYASAFKPHAAQVCLFCSVSFVQFEVEHLRIFYVCINYRLHPPDLPFSRLPNLDWRVGWS